MIDDPGPLHVVVDAATGCMHLDPACPVRHGDAAVRVATVIDLTAGAAREHPICPKCLGRLVPHAPDATVLGALASSALAAVADRVAAAPHDLADADADTLAALYALALDTVPRDLRPLEHLARLDRALLERLDPLGRAFAALPATVPAPADVAELDRLLAAIDVCDDLLAECSALLAADPDACVRAASALRERTRLVLVTGGGVPRATQVLIAGCVLAAAAADVAPSDAVDTAHLVRTLADRIGAMTPHADTLVVGSELGFDTVAVRLAIAGLPVPDGIDIASDDLRDQYLAVLSAPLARFVCDPPDGRRPPEVRIVRDVDPDTVARFVTSPAAQRVLASLLRDDPLADCATVVGAAVLLTIDD